MVERHRPAEREHHVMRVVIFEGEAVALSGLLIVGVNGIIQTARFPHDRYAAIAQGKKLADPARLEFGRHEEQIARRINFAGQCVIEQNL
ncbi:hypothetical protein D3C75_655370 [compost metagenome]